MAKVYAMIAFRSEWHIHTGVYTHAIIGAGPASDIAEDAGTRAVELAIANLMGADLGREPIDQSWGYYMQVQSLTVAKFKRIARTLGMTARKRDGEWRITFATGTPARLEAVAYYTDDMLDAFNTMRAMYVQNATHARPEFPVIG